MTDKPVVNLWASFLANHRLHPIEPVDVTAFLNLCDRLATKGSPKVRPHSLRLHSRRLVCETAMEIGFDLTKIRRHGMIAMTRGLLDMWNTVYQEKYGGTYGTSGAKEATRRNVKTRLAHARTNAVPEAGSQKDSTVPGQGPAG